MIRINRGVLIVLIVLIIVAAAIAGTFLSSQFSRWKNSSESSAQKNIYYCPMHPTYTSDKPGDCPICNMKLVKKENPSSIVAAASKTKSFRDICYLHNCEKLHEGKACPMLMVGKEGEKVTCPICGTHVATQEDAKPRKILFWTDPMIPGYKSDKPGKSPMGMDLIPVYEEDIPATDLSAQVPDGYAPVVLTPQKQKMIGIKTALVKEMPMTKTIRTVGRIAYDPELYQTEEEFIQAQQAYQKAEQGNIPEIKEQSAKLVDSAKLKLKLMGLSDALIEELQTSGKPDRSLLYSEKGGTAWLYAPIYEYEIPLVKIGDSVEVEVPALPEKKFQGIIRSVDPVLDRMTRSVRIRAVLENPDGVLKPEMYVNATLRIDLGQVLGVPEAAVFSTGERNIVFVANSNGIFEPREVTLGPKAEGYYEVKSGLTAGESVVTSGNFLIDSESRLKAALEGMGSDNGSGSGVHQHGG